MNYQEKQNISNSIDTKIYGKENQDFINNNPQLPELIKSISNLNKEKIFSINDILEKGILYGSTNIKLNKFKKTIA